MGLSELHDDEIKARLGMPIERERPYEGPLEAVKAAVEDRIEALAVASMPEEFDPEVDVDFELIDMHDEEKGGQGGDRHRGN